MLPEWAKEPLRQIRDAIRAVPYLGTGRLCPVCESPSRRFRPFGVVPRAEAQCVHCGALERHRFLWLYLKRKTDLFDGRARQMLHVAPEACFESRFKQQLGGGYLTADLFKPGAMVKMDITDIKYANESFDVIYCSHVLEHVHDDRRAMREFFRVLKADGWAILLVPITSASTFEDPSITDPKQRVQAFGQEDHVRRYGPDYVDRLRAAGFTVRISRVSDVASGDEAARMGLSPAAATGEIYFCTK